MKTNVLLAVVLAFLLFFCAAAGAQTLLPFLAGYDVGLIFNTDNLLMDFESYQGGLGVKISGDKLAYRLLVDFFATTESGSIDMTLGGAVEYHLRSGRVSPYLGGHLTVGYARAAAAGVKSVSVPVTAGGLFGMEVYLLRWLSLFAEYDFSLTMQYSMTDTDTAGVETSDEAVDWTVQLGAGNQSKIGIVLYIQQGRDLALDPIARDRR